MKWSDIPGHFYCQDAYDAALSLIGSGVFVEVGALAGRSTAYLATQIRDRQLAIEFFAVDTWNGSHGVDARSDKVYAELLHKTEWFDDFHANMMACGVSHHLKPLRMSSLEAIEYFPDQSVSFCFIDAAHDRSSVLADLEGWFPKVRPGGLIGGDDYGVDWPGVDQAVHEFKDKQQWSCRSFWKSPPRAWLYRKPIETG